MGGGGGRGKHFGPLKSLGFQQLSYFVTFWTGGKNSLDYFQKKYGNID